MKRLLLLINYLSIFIFLFSCKTSTIKGVENNTGTKNLDISKGINSNVDLILDTLYNQTQNEIELKKIDTISTNENKKIGYQKLTIKRIEHGNPNPEKLDTIKKVKNKNKLII
jgi:hypothetical protein